MIYRMLDDTGDYVFGRGKHVYLEGAEAVAQAIKTRLRLLYTEWWEDREDGLPLWEKIISSSGSEDNIRAVDAIYKERILGTTGVMSLMGFTSNFDRDNRVYTFKAAVNTIYGTLLVSGGNTEVS